jgi:hypothetical protein
VTGNGSPDGAGGHLGLSGPELRDAVRGVLRDVLPDLLSDRRQSFAATTSEAVSLHTDADLDTFVRRLLVMFEDPAQREAVRTGRTSFRLAAEATDRTPQGSHGTTGGVVRVERGAVTEKRVGQAAAHGARLVVGRRAVLTPLARDKARALGVVVEKET